MKPGRDMVSFTAGVGLVAFGALLILDQAETLELTAGWFGAALAAMLGSILIVSGMSE
jgi:hypothetical protein